MRRRLLQWMRSRSRPPPTKSPTSLAAVYQRRLAFCAIRRLCRESDPACLRPEPELEERGVFSQPLHHPLQKNSEISVDLKLLTCPVGSCATLLRRIGGGSISEYCHGILALGLDLLTLCGHRRLNENLGLFSSRPRWLPWFPQTSRFMMRPNAISSPSTLSVTRLDFTHSRFVSAFFRSTMK